MIITQAIQKKKLYLKNNFLKIMMVYFGLW